MATASEVCKALNEVEAALSMLQGSQSTLTYWLGRPDARDFCHEMLTHTNRLRTALEQLAAFVTEELPR